MKNSNFFNGQRHPLVSLIALIFLVVFIAVLFAGCSVEKDDNDEITAYANEYKRFEVEYFNISSYSSAHVITDNETGEQYLFYKFGSQGGLTKLETGSDAK